MDATNDERAWVVWLSAGSCEGCTMAVLGATSPRLEELMSGLLTQIPVVTVIHPMLSLGAGAEYVSQLEQAAAGELDPFILVIEGAMLGNDASGSPHARIGPDTSVERWLERLAPRAAATVALGTCATDGGIPAAAGSPTGARGVEQDLPLGYRSAGDLPLIRLPGCAPPGDAFVETLSYIVLHLGGRVPLDLDDQQRPRWRYDETVDVHVLGDDFEATAACSVPAQGWINRLGGCAEVGGACIGCTRPDFPDLERSPIDVF